VGPNKKLISSQLILIFFTHRIGIFLFLIRRPPCITFPTVSKQTLSLDLSPQNEAFTRQKFFVLCVTSFFHDVSKPEIDHPKPTSDTSSEHET